MNTDANYTCLMTDSQMDTLINVHWKERAWQKGVDENEDVTYTQVTWRQLTERRAYKHLYGRTPFFNGCKWQGVDLGDRYLVSGRIIEALDDEAKLISLGFGPILDMEEAEQFLTENK